MSEFSVPTEVSSRTDRLVVGICTQNEFLRYGLEAMLRGFPRIAAIRYIAYPPPSAPIAVDIIIATPAEQEWLKPIAEEVGPSHPRILIVVDELSHKNIGILNSFAFDGILLRDELSTEVLVDALERLETGQLLVPNSLAKQLMARVAGSVRDRHAWPAALTSRESETIALLGSGMSNKQIARALGISSHGAKRLVGSVLLKLGAANRTAAVVSAIKAGIIDPD